MQSGGSRPNPAHPVLHRFGKLFFRVSGWRFEVGEGLMYPKYVVIGAHHTSNWDALVGLSYFGAANIHVSFMIKQEWKSSPIWPMFEAFGAVPIDRSQPKDVVPNMVKAFTESDSLVVGITPEGTRKFVEYWHTGFYWIAHQAQVPILLAYADYQKKVIGIGQTIFPSGDLEADMQLFREFYADVHPKYPEKAGIIRTKQSMGPA